MAPISIESRLELFVDDYLVDRLGGGARRLLHHPQPREIVLVHDRAWEGNTCGYHTFFRDGDLVRAYYRGSHAKGVGGKEAHPQVACTAESDGGVHWRKPALGLVEFQGSTANNIILANRATHNFTAFRDDNPSCPPAQRYKGLGGSRKSGLLPFASPDGRRWHFIRAEPVITDGAFDSQNLAFWDAVQGQYRAYYRDFAEGVRGIKTATSPDFLNWSAGQWLQYTDSPNEHLYTNQVLPYFRAPHILLGFPTRYVPDRDQITEGLFMSSRDGLTFQRWGEALIRPGLNRDRWGNRCNYIWHGLVETAGEFPGAPNELSLYSTEHYYEGNANWVRRFTLRMDGFVSVNAPLAGGEVVTQPLLFTGEQLLLNLSTAAAGIARVELQDADGRPIEGFALENCDELWGDSLEIAVTWNGSADVSALAGRPVRLRVSMSDADLYAFRFAPPG
jgi:hypothetical protein